MAMSSHGRILRYSPGPEARYRVLREVSLPQGLVDNKVCAVDEVWSGLRFVWRKENRPARS